MPLLTTGSSDYSDSLSIIESELPGTDSSGSQEEKDKSMDTAMASVVKSMSGAHLNSVLACSQLLACCPTLGT